MEKVDADNNDDFNSLWHQIYASPENLIILGDKLAFELLTENLTSGNCYTRSSAARALGFLKYPESIPSLMIALDDEDAAVRREALDSILLIDWVNSKKALEKASRDEDINIRQKSEVALRKGQGIYK